MTRIKDMYQGKCICEAVHWKFTAPIESVTACNCTACSRYGVLWAYGHEGVDVSVTGPTKSYIRGSKFLEFVFCGDCGCLAAWKSLTLDKEGKRRVAVNVRLIDRPEMIADLPIDHFDGLNTFVDRPQDHRCVKDMWY
jgi:hypothetical protein